MRNRFENSGFQIRESRALLVKGERRGTFWFIIFPAYFRARMYIYLISWFFFLKALLSGDFLEWVWMFTQEIDLTFHQPIKKKLT